MQVIAQSQSNLVTAWLRRKVYTSAGLSVLGGIVACLAGAVVLFLTYWITCGILWFVLRHFDLDPIIYMISSVVFIILLFIGNARTDEAYLSEFTVTTGTFSNTPVVFYIPGVGMCSNINPLAPDSIHSMAKVITSFLYVGPRLLTAAWRFCRKAHDLLTLDQPACAAVLALLYTKSSRVPFDEIARAIAGLNPAKVFSQLGHIDGVMFLQEPPAGMALSTELREDISSAGD